MASLENATNQSQVTQFLLLIVDWVVTAGVAKIAIFPGLFAFGLTAYLQSIFLANLILVLTAVMSRYIWFYPLLLTPVWTSLYVASGLLVRFARRFDRTIIVINRTLDIENKPLGSIGLVAGALSTLVYWCWKVYRALSR